MEQSFAWGFNFYKLFWIFYIGSFVGVILEMIWCVVRFHKLESRKGLIYGLLNPVYGFGAVIMSLALFSFKRVRDLYIIIFGSVIGGIYEYICSLFQELAFGSVSWDYKDFPLNLHGRINFLYCVFWGMLALLWSRDIYPLLSKIIEGIPNKIGVPLTWILLLFVMCDTLISAIAVYRMKKRLEGVIARNKFWEWIDRHYPDKKLKKVYPNMQFKISQNISLVAEA